MFYFIRHNQLISPYDDYNNLNYSNLVCLSSQVLNPSISSHIESNDILKCIKNENIDKVFTSELLRTQQTAKLLGFNEIEIIKELNEIYFDITKIVTEDEYKKDGIAIVRNNLWNLLSLSNRAIESLSSLDKRINIIIDILKNNKDKNILFVSHGFFLNLLRLKLGGFDISNVDNIKSLSARSINYLDGFSIK